MAGVKYYISPDDEFVIEDYNAAPTFASFFPGIAGIFGCPMWVFYCNRGQCITSAGVQDKDGAILEFQPANKAFRSAALAGFRTFLKIDGKYYEPFGETSPHPKEMRIKPESLKLVETNPELKIRIEVEYFTIPDEPFSGLARSVKLTNLGNKARQVELIDGLPSIIPYGFINDFLKRLSQTIEAWSVVDNLENHAPFYRLKVAPADVSETRVIEQGNFYLAFAHQGGKDQPVELIVDPYAVFGQQKSLELPALFLGSKSYRIPAYQQTQGIMPSAFAFKRAKLPPKGELELYSLIGQADDLKEVNKLRTKANNREFFVRKKEENHQLIDGICSLMETASSKKSFDLYCRQTFLDNVMRGGLPVDLGNRVLYLYYRKHGDLERDYNDFKLMPTFLSQGNGNYRDINQNRRNDIFFNPKVGEDNILRFFNLVQLDGFNPLVVLGSQFFVRTAASADALIKKHVANPTGDLAPALTKPFVLGQLMKKLDEAGYQYRTSRLDFATELLEKAVNKEDAMHGEGYWTDHFSYNTDLLESFESIYPERIKEILFNEKIFTFYDNDHVVVERKYKYRPVGDGVRQYGAVKADLEKAALISNRNIDRNIVRTSHGKGKVYQTTLLAKLLCLIANKAASFDPEGIGLEMEADKPNWYDALNGLPALFGSSLSETLELKRLSAYLLERLDEQVRVNVPDEVRSLIEKLSASLEGYSNTNDTFRYWDESYRLKEEYRRLTKLGVDGAETPLSGTAAAAFLSLVVKKCDDGIRRCLGRYKHYRTYFINELTEFEQVNGHGIRAKKFVQKPLPLFLEGFVHALKVEKDRKIFPLVKNSPLYDSKLKMYKVNAPLEDAPLEIGRAKIFTPGWLENESVWLHMEYKYLLELLKAGLHDEFFGELEQTLIPFLRPAVYKRSILENSSFLVSSAHPDKHNHGRGFVARLSGATAEFIDLWLTMTTGKKIFTLDERGKLRFQLKPALPAWLFNKDRFAFKLLGSIEVVYLNPTKRNTYGPGVSPRSYTLTIDGREVVIDQPFVPEPYARQVRDRRVSKIVVNLV